MIQFSVIFLRNKLNHLKIKELFKNLKLRIKNCHIVRLSAKQVCFLTNKYFLKY